MIQNIVDRLKDADKDARRQARDELMQLARSGTATLDDAAALIRAAAAGGFPKAQHSWEDESTPCIWAARDIARDKDPAGLLPVIEQSFPRLSPAARTGVLQIVVLNTSPEAARLYLHLLKQLGSNELDGFIPEFEAGAGPEVAGALFPQALALARNPKLAYPVFSMLLAFREHGLLAADIAKEYHGSLARVLAAEIEHARALQQPSGLGWRDAEPYTIHRDMIGLMFDMAGLLESKSLQRAVESSGDLLDPRLRRFRAVALTRRGTHIPDAELEWIARSPRDRYWLFQQLHRLGIPERLPEACLDQAKLAEGHMVDWLCFGTELGREPDEIELIHTETRNRSNAHLLVRWLAKRQPVDYYFFRYRVTEDHWAKEDGWMVGMAGGYARSEQPTNHHDGATFSKFESFESKSLQEHIADYLG